MFYMSHVKVMTLVRLATLLTVESIVSVVTVVTELTEVTVVTKHLFQQLKTFFTYQKLFFLSKTFFSLQINCFTFTKSFWENFKNQTWPSFFLDSNLRNHLVRTSGRLDNQWFVLWAAFLDLAIFVLYMLTKSWSFSQVMRSWVEFWEKRFCTGVHVFPNISNVWTMA